jgi:hypothetical protein
MVGDLFERLIMASARCDLLVLWMNEKEEVNVLPSPLKISISVSCGFSFWLTTHLWYPQESITRENDGKAGISNESQSDSGPVTKKQPSSRNTWWPFRGHR